VRLLAALLLLLAACAAPGAPGSAAPGAPSMPTALCYEPCGECGPGIRVAMADEAAGRWAEAAEHFAGLVRGAPRCPAPWMGQARALLALGRPEEAAATLADARVLRPTDTTLRVAHACALHAAGQPGLAAATFAGCDPATLPDDARHAWGRSALLAGDLRAAVGVLDALVASRPGDGAAWLDLARALLLLGEDAAGRVALDRARAAGMDLGALAPLAGPGR
jgi:Flp pilus assembly protein TadD